MSETSRRTFLAMTGGGLVAGTTLVVPEAVAAAAPLTETESGDPVTDGGDMIVAYIRAPRSGEIKVAIGDGEYTFTDRALVRRLITLARQNRI